MSGIATHEFSNQIIELFMLSKSITKIEIKDRSSNLSNRSCNIRKYRSEVIVNEFAFLYNCLVAGIAKRA
ncbi:MAG: hypothetical protein L6V81_08020 [Clostridium sp.]|nr:MAG: hypothetical protein L6V81_08020 [Clostridium sp.]